MRGVTALLLALSLLSSTAQAGLLHVHEYADHTHYDHHRAPAAHSHIDVREPGDLRIESCDPAAHVRALTFLSVRVSVLWVAISNDRLPAIDECRSVTRQLCAPDDVRVHGPPLVFAGLRAPPSPLSA